MSRFWFQGIVICLLALGLCAAISLQLIANANAAANRRDEFCAALPRAAGSGAQALIDISLGQAIKDGKPAAEVERIKKIGAIYVSRAKANVLADLPSCK